MGALWEHSKKGLKVEAIGKVINHFLGKAGTIIKKAWIEDYYENTVL